MKKQTAAILGTLVLAAFLAACNTGGSSSSTSSSDTVNMSISYMMTWDIPKATVDNQEINPFNEIDYYEIYVSVNGEFSDSDVPVAFVSAINDGKLVNQFDLSLIKAEGLPTYSQLVVSMRAVGVDGQKSDFMDPVLWNRS